MRKIMTDPLFNNHPPTLGDKLNATRLCLFPDEAPAVAPFCSHLLAEWKAAFTELGNSHPYLALVSGADTLLSVTGERTAPFVREMFETWCALWTKVAPQNPELARMILLSFQDVAAATDSPKPFNSMELEALLRHLEKPKRARVLRLVEKTDRYQT